MEEIEQEFEGQGLAISNPLWPRPSSRAAPHPGALPQFIGDKAYLEQCYKDNAPKAQRIARKTLQKVMKKVGHLPL